VKESKKWEKRKDKRVYFYEKVKKKKEKLTQIIQ